MSRIKRTYRYRCYPTDVQKGMLARTFGCCRYVYNWALSLKSEEYRQTGKSLTYGDLSALLPLLKQQPDTAWLSNVSSVPLQQSLRHLDKAFQNFYTGRGKYPHFKSKKRSVQAATYAANAFTWDGHSLILAKMETPLEIVWSRSLPQGCTPSTVTVSRDSAGRYFVSILLEEEIKPLFPSQENIGIDLGLTSMVITSSGEKVGNPKYFVREEKRLAKAQRRLSKKQKGSKNREKARRKVAKIHARIADRRRDYQHKLSTRLIRENQVICVESLAVKNMMQHPTRARAIADVGWGEFVRQLEYKAAWYGRTLIKIDQWYPSSKTCSVCAHVLESLDLDVREWTCPNCGARHDRDINAANSVLAEGLRTNAAGLAVSALYLMSPLQTCYNKHSIEEITDMPAAFQWTSEELRDMVTSYEQGESAQSIANRYGTSYQVIQPLLAKRGVTLRSKREANKKQTCNDRYFQAIDTEEKAYWLGFLTADGCVTRGKKLGDSPRISLHLAKQDYGHLVKLKQALQASQMISANERSCSLTIFSAEMATDLAWHGMRPNKTFSTTSAQVAVELERHYWRGVIDGDGDFAKSGDSLKLVGDYDVVLAFQKFVLSYCPQVRANIRKNENIFTFSIRRQATLCMLQAMYGDAKVFLDRKYRRAQEIVTDAVEEI